MALKFLNKKGWHTGSLRNIENVWKAEQKHEQEQRKLEELRKQIHEERERSEFRLLQEQAGLVSKQDRLEFLYDSGLAVGKGAGTSDGKGAGFKALDDALPGNNNNTTTTNKQQQQQQQSSVPGALFEDKSYSANDAWRKLHSDPLLLIRQREQEALSRVKNNPIQMAMIRKSVDEKKHKGKEKSKTDKKKEKHSHSSSKHHRHSTSKQRSDSEDVSDKGARRIKSSDYERDNSRRKRDDDQSSERESYKKNQYKDSKEWSREKTKHEKYSSESRSNSNSDRKNYHNSSTAAHQHESSYNKRQNVAPRLSEEERAARLREMQMDAELHEEQRWKRLKKAEQDDAREATRSTISGGKNFLDAAHRSVYGAEKGGSSTIEESVRRRTYYSQGRSEAGEGNAFRR